VAGGGRYDNLIELLGGPPIPATGISLGIDRLVEVLSDANLLPTARTLTQVFIAHTNPSLKKEVIAVAEKLRSEGIRVEVDIMGRKLDRQLKYADVKGIPYVVILGPQEVERGVYRLRDMNAREERLVNLQELVELLKSRR
jgi:histidyl-tRNA synthetase